MNKEKCIICGCGKANNNAEPVIKGYCCDNCNMMYVIPARFKAMLAAKQQYARNALKTPL